MSQAINLKDIVGWVETRPTRKLRREKSYFFKK
jgi:hypothetical protein